ncbi:MAG: hypothetical protein M1814_005241 [Vezdaea aestivalis]|nr:MAG: hypothetical protein M1814_005241 [Vezdaea aestivalis]
MPPDPSSFQRLNLPPTHALPTSMSYFSLTAPPNTDLWRKPPSRDTSTAPILYTSLRHPFIAAEVTVSADWELEWDQAGIVIFAGAPPGRVPPLPAESPPATTTTTSSAGLPIESTIIPAAPPPYQPAPASKWVKAGLEFCSGRANASSVCATGEGADWSLAPLASSTSAPTTVAAPVMSTSGFNTGLVPAANPIGPPRMRTGMDRPELRVKLERVGYALWVWFEDPGSVGPGGRGCGWKKLREVTWFFWGVEDKAVRVGVYACRPANFGPVWDARSSGGAGGGSAVAQRGLCVDFDGLEIF